MTTPFLFRFRQACQSPNRAIRDDSYQYDPDVDMVIDTKLNPPAPAIDSTRASAPETKKADVEKGEDQKDRRMWQ